MTADENSRRGELAPVIADHFSGTDYRRRSKHFAASLELQFLDERFRQRLPDLSGAIEVGRTGCEASETQVAPVRGHPWRIGVLVPAMAFPRGS